MFKSLQHFLSHFIYDWYSTPKRVQSLFIMSFLAPLYTSILACDPCTSSPVPNFPVYTSVFASLFHSSKKHTSIFFYRLIHSCYVVSIFFSIVSPSEPFFSNTDDDFDGRRMIIFCVQKYFEHKPWTFCCEDILSKWIVNYYSNQLNHTKYI